MHGKSKVGDLRQRLGQEALLNTAREFQFLIDLMISLLKSAIGLIDLGGLFRKSVMIFFDTVECPNLSKQFAGSKGTKQVGVGPAVIAGLSSLR
jgi:hypothetical protein